MSYIIKRTVFLLCIIFPSHAVSETRFLWDGSFSETEKNFLSSIVQQSNRGVEELFGIEPPSYRAHFYRQKGSSPVPFGEVDKRYGGDAHFYVDPRHPNNEFKTDWTVPHEVSHLLFPYLGKKSRWFSEGLSTYLQYQILYAAKALSWSTVVRKLRNGFSAAQQYSKFDQISIVELNDIVDKERGYVRMYWGGAAFFLRVDYLLQKEHQTSLNDVIRQYSKCCRSKRVRNARDMMVLFDSISSTDIFSTTYQETVLRKGFPQTSEALTWLAAHPVM